MLPEKTADDVFELASVDITALPLTTDEGFIVSRLVGRRVGAADLARETGFSLLQVNSLLESLVKKGALSFSAVQKAPPPQLQVERDPYAGMVFSPGDLADGKDLTLDQKKRILLVEDNLDEWNHYTLLGIKRTAKPIDIKSGYFKASKEFHPDAHFRKDLGKYDERIDHIFRAMKAAYDVLSKPEMRAAYDETLVGYLSPEEIFEISQILDERKREAERKARLLRVAENQKKARLRWNPMAQRLVKSRELFNLAQAARKAGKLDEARSMALLACGYDEALKVRVEPLLKEIDTIRLQALLKKIQAAVKYGEESLGEEILRLADQAAEQAEQLNSAPLLIDVAKLMQTLRQPQKAFKLASVVCGIDDKVLEAWKIVCQIAVAEQKWAIASRAAERWLQLEPTAAYAKDIVKKAKSMRSG